MLRILATASAFVALCAGVAGAQTKWDLPTAYPANNFHTENIAEFAKEVEQATGGKLKIQIHAAASLFKAQEIKRAVQQNNAQVGEILLANFENENALYGADGVPFLATSYAEAMKLWKAQKSLVTALLDKQGMAVLFSVPWPPQGIYSKKPINSAADMKGLKFRSY
ncbi:MAG: TRAP transporter substrate-binding protein DctP, partial [Alphaproteobacteria bacterium]